MAAGATFLELPELQVVVLESSDVERALAELAFETTVLTVLIKGGTTERAQAESPSLGTARESLLAGEASGVQVHYAHRGDEWWATFMRAGGAFRLVRVRRHVVSEEGEGTGASKSPGGRP